VFNPCCCNPANCNICNDAFTLSDGTDVSTGTACGYTEVSGDWSIASSRLEVASSSAILSINAETTGNNLLLVKSNISDVNKAARLIFDFVDSDNYLCGEFVCLFSGWITPRIIRRTAGVETILATGVVFSAGTWTLAACYHSSTGRFAVSSHTGFGTLKNTLECMIDCDATINSGALAIGSGPSLPSAIWFDDIDVDHTTAAGGNCNVCLKCDKCTTDFDGEQNVSIANFGGAAPPCCATCSDLDGDYVLTYHGYTRFQFGASNSYVCVWAYEFPAPVCGYRFIYAYHTFFLHGWTVMLASKNIDFLAAMQPFISATDQSTTSGDVVDCPAATMTADYYYTWSECGGGGCVSTPTTSVVLNP